MRLRTKFLLTMLLISLGVTTMSLLVVRRSVERHLRDQIVQDMRNSVTRFRSAQAQREAALQHAAALMANLPILRAMMTSADPATIQDASADLFRLVSEPAGGRSSADLLVIADRQGAVVGLHTTGAEFGRDRAHQLAHASLERNEPSTWWYSGGRLEAYDRNTGAFPGFLHGACGPLVIDRLRYRLGGNTANNGAANMLFFAAGPNDEQHGFSGS